MSALTPNNYTLNSNGTKIYYGNVFSAPFRNIAISNGSFIPIFLINNPSTTKSICIQSFSVEVDNASSICLFANPTVTSNGTTITPSPLRPGSATTSIATCYSGPTVSSNGTMISNAAVASNYASQVDNYPLIVLDPGNSLLMTGSAGNGVTNVFMRIFWYEV